MRARRSRAGAEALPAAAADGGTPREDGGRQESFLTFQVGADVFGIPLADVSEIIRLPRLAHMPLAPPSLLGLANLRGTVLPVVGIARLLRVEERPLDAASRVIVIQRGIPVGIAVHRIGGLLTVPAARIERADEDAGATATSHVDGLIKGLEGESTTKILNATRLLREEFARLGTPLQRKGVSSVVAVSPQAPADARPRLTFISFELGEEDNAQEYALPLDAVHEVVALPAHMSTVPRPEVAVLGVVTLRGRLLPVVSLRTLIGLPHHDVGAGVRGKVVVVALGAARIGLVADRTREILRIAPDVIEPAPALLTRGEGDAEITAICRLDKGRRLVAVLSPDRLFRSDVVRRVLADHDADGIAAETGQSTMTEEQFVVFRLGGQDYGLPIAAVEEIARRPDHMTRLPKAPKFIDGVINLRGTVVPVIDLRHRFDLAPGELKPAERILVVGIGATRAGFMVDDVLEIRRVPTDAIHRAPELSPEQMRLIGRVANLEGRMILLVDPGELLDRSEAGQLAGLDQASLAPASL